MTLVTWFVGALFALIAEFMTGTFYLLVVALALSIGGLAALIGLSDIPQFIAASIAGAAGVCLVSWWKRRRLPSPPAELDDPDIGQSVRVLRRDATGLLRVHYRGTEWDARFSHDAPDAEQGWIIRRDGNLFILSTQPPERR